MWRRSSDREEGVDDGEEGLMTGSGGVDDVEEGFMIESGGLMMVRRGLMMWRRG